MKTADTHDAGIPEFFIVIHANSKAITWHMTDDSLQPTIANALNNHARNLPVFDVAET